jgi:hypothetical protein
MYQIWCFSLDNETIENNSHLSNIAQAFFCSWSLAFNSSKFERWKNECFFSLARRRSLNSWGRTIVSDWWKEFKDYKINKKTNEIESLWIFSSVSGAFGCNLNVARNYQPWKRKYNCDRLWQIWLWSVRKKTKREIIEESIEWNNFRAFNRKIPRRSTKLPNWLF